MNSLRDVFETVDRRRKTLEVHTDEESVFTALRDQFDARTVDVTHRSLGAIDETGFVIVRDDDGGFRGALGLDQFEAILSPEVHPPWELAETDVDHADLFDFLENTLFSSYDRRQMLLTSREIEERAWRVGTGRLYAGFQRSAALRSQAAVYERLGQRGTLAIAAFVDGAWDVTLTDAVTVVAESADELGSFWFVAFDGGGNAIHRCAMVAEERDAGQYSGLWTFDPAIVGELFAYLESTYDVSPRSTEYDE